jgi:hypothetical protein
VRPVKPLRRFVRMVGGLILVALIAAYVAAMYLMISIRIIHV